MRVFLLSSFSFLFLFNGFAQEHQFTYIETSAWGDPYSTMTARAFIKNTSSDTLYLKAKRNEVSLVAGSINYFCWDVCYTPSTDFSINALPVAPGDTIEDFYADYEASGNLGTSTIQYCFYKESDQSDSICINISFTATPTGIETITSADANTVSAAYPNPTSGSSRVQYTLKNNAKESKIEIHNLLGSLIKTVALTNKAGVAELQLSEAEAGIYFYSLVVDDKTISTRKLIVN